MAKQRKTQLQKQIDKLVGPVRSVKTANGCPRTSNEKYVCLVNKFGRNFLKAWKPTIAQYVAGSNLKVSATLDTSRTLLYLDFDTHKTGSTADVHTLFNRLRNYLPDLLEPTVNERGGSNWLVVETWEGETNVKRRSVKETEYNALIREFQRRLQVLGDDLDIEHIEAKGKVYEHTHCEHTKRLLTVKAADLLKCPTEAKYVEQKPISVKRLREVVESLPAESKQPKPEKANQGGSWTGRLLSDQHIANLDTLAKQVERAYPDRPTHAGRHLITARRFAEILASIVVLKTNADGTNPVERHRAFIDAVQEDGGFDHRFRFEVYKAVRDYLSRCDNLKWVDVRYTFDLQGGHGRAAKWSVRAEVTAWVVSSLAGEHTPRPSLITTSIRLEVYPVPTLAVTPSSLLLDYRRADVEDWFAAHYIAA